MTWKEIAKYIGSMTEEEQNTEASALGTNKVFFNVKSIQFAVSENDGPELKLKYLSYKE